MSSILEEMLEEINNRPYEIGEEVLTSSGLGIIVGYEEWCGDGPGGKVLMAEVRCKVSGEDYHYPTSTVKPSPIRAEIDLLKIAIAGIVAAT